MAHAGTERTRRSDRHPSGRSSAARVAVAVLLGVGIVVPLLVFLYDSEKPALWGFPFYYWFQFLTIPVVSLLTFTAFRISQAADRRERTRIGLPDEPAGDEQR